MERKAMENSETVFLTVYNHGRKVIPVKMDQIKKMPIRGLYDSPVGLIHSESVYKTEESAWKAWQGYPETDNRVFKGNGYTLYGG